MTYITVRYLAVSVLDNCIKCAVCSVAQLLNRKLLIQKQNTSRPCTCNVLLSEVSSTIRAVGKQKLMHYMGVNL
jgi:hypothetical protein